MRSTIVLAAVLFFSAIAAPAAGSSPILCNVVSVCASVGVPTTLSGPVQCREVVTDFGGSLSCAVSDGHVTASAYGCQYCLPLTIAACQEGTEGVSCSSPSLVMP